MNAGRNKSPEDSGGKRVPPFVLTGKIIDRANQPAEGLRVKAFDDDPWINPADFLGESLTGPDGSFRIEFDRSRFAPFWELLEGSPDVYISVRDAEDRQVLRTRIQRTDREIEFHIRLGRAPPDPAAKDIYAANPQRLVNMLGDVGELIGVEQSLNLDLLANGQLPNEIRKRLEEFGAGFGERINHFNHFAAAINGLVNSYLEERRLGSIGYDGPQVPRFPHREAYDQVIIWPRKEAFRWG